MMVRLPRFERWVGQVTREQEWLPKLAPHLPLPVPTPLAQSEPGDGYPFPWSVYGWLPGDRVDVAGLTDLRQTAAALADFSRRCRRSTRSTARHRSGATVSEARELTDLLADH